MEFRLTIRKSKDHDDDDDDDDYMDLDNYMLCDSEVENDTHIICAC